MNPPSPETQRREYHRIDDTPLLSYHPCRGDMPPAQRLQGLLEQADPRHTLIGEFSAGSDYIHRQLGPLGTAQVELRRAIKTLDEKINRLAQLFVAQALRQGEEQVKAINLSAGGLAFLVDEPLAVGSQLALRLVLRPSLHTVIAVAEVVACVESAGGWLLRARFAAIRDLDRDQLVRHIMGRESRRLRAAAEAEANAG